MMLIDTSRQTIHRLALMLVGVALVGNHAIQFVRVMISVVGLMLRPDNARLLHPEGVGSWAVYYGGITGVVEAVLLIALGAMLFFGSVTARKVLAILLPILLLHDVLYSIVIGVSFVDIAVPISIDVCAWLVILAILWNGKDRHPATDAQRV